jgi:hypothetical protein
LNHSQQQGQNRHNVGHYSALEIRTVQTFFYGVNRDIRGIETDGVGKIFNWNDKTYSLIGSPRDQESDLN